MPSRNVRTSDYIRRNVTFDEFEEVAPPLIQHGCFAYLEDFGTMKSWQWVRVQTLKKKSTKHDMSMHCPIAIQINLELCLFDIAPNLLTVYTHPQFLK